MNNKYICNEKLEVISFKTVNEAYAYLVLNRLSAGIYKIISYER